MPPIDRTVWTSERSRKVAIGLLAVIAVIHVGWALRATYVVTMPLAFAFFVAVLVEPVRHRLAARLPGRWRWLGVAAAMLLIVAVLALLAGAFWLGAEPVAAKAPQYLDKLQGSWDQLAAWARRNDLPEPGDADQAAGLRERIIGLASGVVQSVWGVLALVALVFFLVLLMLLEVPEWREKSHAAFRQGRAAAVLDAADAVAAQVRRYLLTQTAIGLISGVVEGLWLWLMGVDLALLWGFLFFLLNYIPNVGSVIAAIPPTLLALVQFGPGWAALVLAGLIALEQVIGNLLHPWLQGRALRMSPLVVLLSVIFWGWAWGVAGAVLAVPLTATIIIVCAHVPALEPVALLFSRDATGRSPPAGRGGG